MRNITRVATDAQGGQAAGACRPHAVRSTPSPHLTAFNTPAPPVPSFSIPHSHPNPPFHSCALRTHGIHTPRLRFITYPSLLGYWFLRAATSRSTVNHPAPRHCSSTRPPATATSVKKCSRACAAACQEGQYQAHQGQHVPASSSSTAASARQVSAVCAKTGAQGQAGLMKHGMKNRLTGCVVVEMCGVAAE